MSPRTYRLLLGLPGLGFVFGAILFCVPIARSSTTVFAPLAIVICVVSLLALAVTGILVRCPRCGKSPYLRLFFRDSSLPFFLNEWGAPWPERNCSGCGLEVGAAPD